MRQLRKERQEAPLGYPSASAFPNTLFDLLSLYEREDSNFMRICALAKIKNMIIT